MELQATLNRLAGTTGMEAQAAANALAGTAGMEMLAALNYKAGTQGLGLNGVCKELARQFGGDDGLDAQGALDSIEAFLLAEFPLLLRASDVIRPTLGWTASEDNWINSGTAGSALDAEPSGGVPEFLPAFTPGTYGYHRNTNSTTSITTPDSAAIDVAGDIDLRSAFRAGRDSTALENRAPCLARITTLDSNVAGYDDLSYELSITTVDEGGLNIAGRIQLIWHDGSTQHAVGSDLGAAPELALDPYTFQEIRATLDVNDGSGHHVVTLYVRDDDDPDDVTDDGKGWRIHGAPLDPLAGTTSIRDTSGPLTVASFDCAVGYAEVYDGIDGVLVADFNPGRDATGPILPTDTLTSSTSGEVWTVGAFSVIAPFIDHARFLMSSDASFPEFSVPDSSLIDLGTVDGAWVFVFEVTEVADTDNDQFLYFNKVTGTIGAGGVGWQCIDIKIDGFSLDGFGVLSSDGSGFGAGLNNTFSVGRHVVVQNYDRDGNVTTYVDGTARGTADISALGTLSNAAELVIGGIATTWYVEAVGFIPRLLTASERADIGELLT